MKKYSLEIIKHHSYLQNMLNRQFCENEWTYLYWKSSEKLDVQNSEGKIDKYIDDTVDEIFDEYEKAKKEKEAKKETEDKGISDFARHMFETLEPLDRYFLKILFGAMSKKPKIIGFDLMETYDEDGTLVYANNTISFYFESSIISDFHFYVHGTYFETLCRIYGVKSIKELSGGKEVRNHKLTVPFEPLYKYLMEMETSE